MSHSVWLKTDLHIHSEESNKTKDNDYTGKLTYDNLVSALIDKEVSLFSITDHNTVNIELYRTLIEKRDDLIKKNLNFIIGAEIDFYDISVHDKAFHMLVYFDTGDLGIIKKIFEKLYEVEDIEDIGKTVKKFTISDFFKIVFSYGVKDIITIPHYRDKDNGLPSKDSIDKFVYTVFNALEDSNNSEKIASSIKYYNDNNYKEVPVVVFSDNHNIDNYPNGKNESDNTTSICVMGNIDYPFESIKMAFQDVDTRISIERTGTRNSKIGYTYIEEIKIDDQTIKFSPYQNTIIGGFGTGKSFLLDMILKGKDNVNQKYNQLANKYNNFEIKLSTGININSLNEIKHKIKIIEFEQYKDIYFKEILEEEDKNRLEKNLDIKFPNLEKKEIFKYEELINSYKKLKEYSEEALTDKINYSVYSQKSDKEYSFKNENIEDVFVKSEYIENLLENLEIESNKEILEDIEIYENDEKEQIMAVKSLISNKNIEYSNFNIKTSELIVMIEEFICDKNRAVEERESKLTGTVEIVNKIKDNLKQQISELNVLRLKSEEFEKTYSDLSFNEYKNVKEEVSLFKNYKLIAQYKTNNDEKNLLDSIFKSNHRKTTVFASIISMISAGEELFNKKTFEENVRKFVEWFNSNFANINYDIYQDNLSILKKSAGEKANAIINIIFEKIKNYSEKKVQSIIILDQPEDNLDNKGIESQVVNEIRKMKKDNILPQLICVTHNANISITADSENIIVASKFENTCRYENGGLENPEFSDKVCAIVEGSKEALKRRGTKFNVPIIKELEKGGKVNE